MAIDNITFDKIVKSYKKYVEPFLAIIIVVGIIYACISGYQNLQEKKQIAENCGWGDEEVKCWCQKSDYVIMSSNGADLNLSFSGDQNNVSLDR